MIGRWIQELKLVEEKYGELELGPNKEWFVIKSWPLSSGWNKPVVSVLVMIPPGYPTTPPDNFYVDNDLLLLDGRGPNSSTPNQNLAGRTWRQFSYHVHSDWQPDADMLKGHNLLTFLLGVGKRLSEVD